MAQPVKVLVSKPEFSPWNSHSTGRTLTPAWLSFSSTCEGHGMYIPTQIKEINVKNFNANERLPVA